MTTRTTILPDETFDLEHPIPRGWRTAAWTLLKHQIQDARDEEWETLDHSHANEETLSEEAIEEQRRFHDSLYHARSYYW